MTFAVVIISAGAEWREARRFYEPVEVQATPYGECFEQAVSGRQVIFLHGGWGKIAAAASAQYALDRWSPHLMLNLGTCGGFAAGPQERRVQRGDILLVERTLVYDIIEQMGDADAAIRHFSVDLDLTWLADPLPQSVRRSLLVSADRDICPQDIPMLMDRYQAVAADWESGAIAWVASHNRMPCLILRGVSDMVSDGGGEAYGAVAVFHEGVRLVMQPMFTALPAWLDCASAALA